MPASMSAAKPKTAARRLVPARHLVPAPPVRRPAGGRCAAPERSAGWHLGRVARISASAFIGPIGGIIESIRLNIDPTPMNVNGLAEPP